MDGLSLLLFLAATFLGALVAGLSGFAFGLVVASLWLYILTPLQVATLIVAFGLIVQGYAVWKLRHALDGKKLLPFVLGAVIGVPIGISILAWTNPANIKIGIGCLLVLYSLYVFFRPNLGSVTKGGAFADAGVGFANGILGGLTGLAGILVTIWCGLRGGTKDQQRTVFQPVAVATFAIAALWFGVKGTLSADTIRLFLFGLPRAAGRHLARNETLWPTQRGNVPKTCSRFADDVRRLADFGGTISRALFKLLCEVRNDLNWS